MKKMKLYGSSRSPYVRKVLIAAHETGAIRDIVVEPMVVTALAANPTMLSVNPLGQIPTLILDDGQALFDSNVICRYLDLVPGKAQLHPREVAAEIAMMRLLALGDGLIAALMSLLSEKSRNQPDQSERRLAALKEKLPLIFAALEAEAPGMMHAPFDMAQIAIASALSYIDFRLPADVVWRDAYPSLANWFAALSQRPSVVATAYFDELAAAAASSGKQEKAGKA
ncbi:MAG: glutathione S-transferase [Aquamicrobium sp.]|uniref:glutathione S-transferase family protein n=1 Tax=Mesorhizobium sp. Pch-S TaxID=2082387 RepID=UPI0010103573|nr:glutathione S-transferase [Mesorhizobium sp. Pch-S]MBR2687352.1 glutathione S-transferase [Aquamicrobium sp.]QAZ45065.1 glutathione S-transferase [Mesorhizobium sp. Pch-S]